MWGRGETRVDKYKGTNIKEETRGDKGKEKGEIHSKVIYEACHKENIPVINHSNINPKRHFNWSKLHSNNYGNSAFGKNILNFLTYVM